MSDALPRAWIDRIFVKLHLTYGREFLDRWEGVNIELVKDDWAHQLAGFQNFPEGIAYALGNLPEGKPPSVRDFKALAKRAPAAEYKALPLPVASAQVIAAAAAALSKPKQEVPSWPERIIARVNAGEKVSPTVLKWAREMIGETK